ncbi:MAG: hypothetical protein MK066_13380 [Crocinitomicaceae bacterium]|nr:hypothetical protein [Crocinitomicaceae bacterium]
MAILHNRNFLNEDQKEVQISKTPEGIDLEGIKIEKKQCISNSHEIIVKNESVKMIEGVILLIDVNNGAKAIQHVWNSYKGVHFDVTKEQVIEGSEEEKEIKTIRYYPFFEYQKDEFGVNEEFKFHDHTTNIEQMINSKLSIDN